jgi:hypothetical protein
MFNSEIEKIDSCFLVSPGEFSYLFNEQDFLLESVALPIGTAADSSPITIVIDGKKYFERLALHCVPFYRLDNRLFFRMRQTYKDSIELYASGKIFLCGKVSRKVDRVVDKKE